MRAVRFAPLLFAGLAVLPACSDENNDISEPLTVSWLEWADSVTAGVPFGVRVYGVILRSRDYLRILVQVNGDNVTIQPYSVGPPCNSACTSRFFVYDTLMWVPAIAATSPRTVTLWAPSSDASIVRRFGSLTVSSDTVVQPLTRSVGAGSGLRDSFGCYVIRRGLLLQSRLVSADQSPTWAPGFTGFVYGRVDPVLGSPCVLEAPVILVDSIGT